MRKMNNWYIRQRFRGETKNEDENLEGINIEVFS